jgi:hypothetical protein
MFLIASDASIKAALEPVNISAAKSAADLLSEPSAWI